MDVQVQALAALLRVRNEVDQQLAEITGRPTTTGHLGEWIAAKVLGVQLFDSASQAGADGTFGAGPLHGQTVNVKCYTKREGVLDMVKAHAPDYYLVLAGPSAPAASSRGTLRPLLIETVHIFDATALHESQRSRGVSMGVASSVRRADWDAAEIYPKLNEALFILSDAQREMLRLFGARTERPGSGG